LVNVDFDVYFNIVVADYGDDYYDNDDSEDNDARCAQSHHQESVH